MNAPEGMVWVSGEQLQKLLDERAEALRLLDMAYRGEDYSEAAKALFLATEYETPAHASEAR